MGHNSVVSGHPKSTGIPRVDGLSTRPPDLGRHKEKYPNSPIVFHFFWFEVGFDVVLVWVGIVQ